jgi:hypothetical protein
VMSDCVNILICSVYLNGGCVPYRCQDYRQMSLCSEINIEKQVTVKNESIESLTAERDRLKAERDELSDLWNQFRNYDNILPFELMDLKELELLNKITAILERATGSTINQEDKTDDVD